VANEFTKVLFTSKGIPGCQYDPVIAGGISVKCRMVLFINGGKVIKSRVNNLKYNTAVIDIYRQNHVMYHDVHDFNLMLFTYRLS